MGSSVSSERAFSAAGNVISKRRNRLQADLVEALQFLKYLYQTDLLFQEQETAAIDVASDDEEEGFLEGLDLDDVSGSHTHIIDFGNGF